MIIALGIAVLVIWLLVRSVGNYNAKLRRAEAVAALAVYTNEDFQIRFNTMTMSVFHIEGPATTYIVRRASDGAWACKLTVEGQDRERKKAKRLIDYRTEGKTSEDIEKDDGLKEEIEGYKKKQKDAEDNDWQPFGENYGTLIETQYQVYIRSVSGLALM